MNSDASSRSITDLCLAGSALTGACTSFLTISACHPLFTIKTRYMSKLPFPNSKQLYAGYAANLSCDISNQLVAFFAFNYFSNHLMGGKALSEKEQFAGGIFAGMAAAPLLSALERIMIIQQNADYTQRKESMFAVAQRIVRSEGAKGFVRGLAPALCRESVTGCCFFYLSQRLLPGVQKRVNNKFLSHILSYQMAGCIAGVLSTPFDLIKTRLQNRLGPPQGIIACINEIGVRHLFRGALARSSTIGSTMMIMGIISHRIPEFLPKTFLNEEPSHESR